jgi:ElaB/YqjD/DUF883 family membrane-anchored ribosome-binding protein
MNTTGDNTDFAAQSKDAARNAADKIQDAVRDTKSLSIDKVRGNAQILAQQGRNTIDAAVQQARDTAADVSGSLMTYTKDNPAKAWLIAAASGALLVALIKSLTPSRD